MKTKTEQLSPTEHASAYENKAMDEQKSEVNFKKFTEEIELIESPDPISNSNRGRAAVYNSNEEILLTAD